MASFRIKDGKFLIVDGKFAVGDGACGCCDGTCVYGFIFAVVSSVAEAHHVYLQIDGGDIYYFDNIGNVITGPYWTTSASYEAVDTITNLTGIHTIRFWYNQPTNTYAEDTFEEPGFNITLAGDINNLCIEFDGDYYNFTGGVTNPDIFELIPGLQAAAYVGYNNGDQSANVGGAEITIRCGPCDCGQCDSGTTPSEFQLTLTDVFGAGGAIDATAVNGVYNLPPRSNAECSYGLVYEGPGGEWPASDFSGENWAGISLGGGYYVTSIYVDIGSVAPFIQVKISNTATPTDYVIVQWYGTTVLPGNCMAINDTATHDSTTNSYPADIEVINPEPDVLLEAL